MPRRAVEPLERRTLFAAGGLDPTFGAGGRVDIDIPNTLSDDFRQIAIGGGRIVVGAHVEPTSGPGGTDPAETRVGLAVLDLNGNLDPSFSGDGYASELLDIPGGIAGLAVQDDGKIVVLNHHPDDPGGILTRFNANGSLDAAFGQVVIGGEPRGVTLEPDGDILVGGFEGVGTPARFGAVVRRFASNGTLKGQFTYTSSRLMSSTSIADVQADGKVLISGFFTNDTGTNAFIVRVKADLSGVDTSFGEDGMLVLPTSNSDDYVGDAEVDKQGRILVSVSEAGEDRERVYRLLEDGTLDPTFQVPTLTTPNGTGGGSISITDGGKIIVSGHMYSRDGGYIARLNANGTVDTTFGGGDGQIVDGQPGESVPGGSHVLQPDGRIIALGDHMLGARLQRFLVDDAPPPPPAPPPAPPPTPEPTPPGVTPAPEITVLVDGVVVSSGARVDLGAVAPGDPAPVTRVMIRNDGTGNLQLGTITAPAGYALSGVPASGMLGPTGVAELTVTLAATDAGTYAGTMAVPTNDTDENPFVLALTGVVSSPLPAAPPEAAPVEVTGLTASGLPAVVINGTRAIAAMAVALRNANGAGYAGPVAVAVYASEDGILDASDPLLATVTKSVRMKAGATGKPVKLKVPFTAAPAGQQTLLAAVTAVGATSTAAGPTVSVEPARVHLVGLPAAGGTSKPLTAGRRATLSVPLQNTGNVATARSPVTYNLIFTTDGTEATKVYETTAVGRVKLKPGAARAQKLGITMPAGALRPGTYTVLVRLSAELNQTNGQTVALMPVTIA